MPEADVPYFSPVHRHVKAFRFGLVLALLGLVLSSMLRGTDETSVVHIYEGVVVVVIVFLLVGFVRAFGVGITLTHEGVVTKTTYSTKHFGWERLRHARTLDRPTRRATSAFALRMPGGGEPPVKVVPVLEFADGRDLRLYGLQTVSDYAYDNWVYEAVLAINERLDELRRPPTPR